MDVTLSKHDQSYTDLNAVSVSSQFATQYFSISKFCLQHWVPLSMLPSVEYHLYVLNCYSYLGKKNRKVHPSCMVTVIHHLYSSQTGVYEGFRVA